MIERASASIVFLIIVIPNMAIGAVIVTHTLYILDPPAYYLAQYQNDANTARWVSIFAIGIFGLFAWWYTTWVRRQFAPQIA